MDASHVLTMSRRTLLMAGAGALAAPEFSPAAAADPATTDAWMRDPEQSFINYVRLMGDTSGRLSPQWWRGGYLGIFDDRNPELLFRLESCEMKRCLRLAKDTYEFQVRIFTMFLDPTSGDILHGKPWRNPITGREVVVEPNISGADHLVQLTDDGIMYRTPATGFQARVHLWWSAQGPYMMAHCYRDRPPQRPIPLQEYVTLFGDRAAAADCTHARLETRFNTTFVAPFQGFMETSTELGIAVWHASGHKAESVASLPATYRDQLTRYRPELRDWISAG